MNLEVLDDNLDLLCTALRCSPDVLYTAIKTPEQFYIQRLIPRRRKSRRPREVFEIKDPLRKVHRTIALWLKPHLARLPDCVQGFRTGGSIYKNAKPHAGGRPRLVTVDLEDFFGSVTTQQVREVFRSLGGGRQISLALARLCTYRSALPQGTRCSPMLANLVASELDRRFELAYGERCTYTRYADDLTFSGTWVPSEREIESLLDGTGFRIRPGSFRNLPYGSGQYVTGLYVGGATPQLPRRTRRLLERFVFYAERHGAVSAAQQTLRIDDDGRAIAQMRGLIGWASSMEPSGTGSTTAIAQARVIIALLRGSSAKDLPR